MNQPEPTVGCRACGTVIVASLKDVHKAKGCPAVLKNELYQYRQQHGGAHVLIDEQLGNHHEDIESIDADLRTITARITALEARPTTAETPPEGVQISGWLDDDTDQPIELPTPDEDDEDDEPIAAEVAAPEEPAYPALAPVYSTATDPAEVDDLEARIALQTGNGLHL